MTLCYTMVHKLNLPAHMLYIQDSMKVFFRRDRIITVLIVILMAIFAIVDLQEDIQGNEPFLQIFYEGIVFALAIFGIAVLLDRNNILRSQIKGVKSELFNSNTEAEKWKKEHLATISGIGHAIDLQLTEWGLSPTEKEIALFLLKGLSFREISEIRGTNEKTVRQQALKVYEKSNLSGRTELSAFFLEDMLQPISNTKENSLAITVK